MSHGPYLIYTEIGARFYRAPAPGESHGDWQHGVKGATFYDAKDQAERVLTRITSRLTRHRTRVVPVGIAHKLAAKVAAPPQKETA